MPHNELLARINELSLVDELDMTEEYLSVKALRIVAELHQPIEIVERGILACNACVLTVSTKINPLEDVLYTAFMNYPCKTIQAIEKELN